jgi:hypothetical protein
LKQAGGQLVHVEAQGCGVGRKKQAAPSSRTNVHFIK